MHATQGVDGGPCCHTLHSLPPGAAARSPSPPNVHANCAVLRCAAGTAHAILETRGNLHYGHDDAKGGEQAKALGRGAAAGAATDAAAAKTDTGAAGTNTAAAAAAGGGGGGPAPGTIHTLCTGNGSPYQNYQIRIALATYKLTQAMPGGERHVAFTRILHRTKPDALMGEVDTFRAEPLQPKCDDWCDYPVSDRGNAVVQFFQAAEKDPGLIKGEWIYMVESDYVFMKPLPLPSAESQVWGWGGTGRGRDGPLDGPVGVPANQCGDLSSPFHLPWLIGRVNGLDGGAHFNPPLLTLLLALPCVGRMQAGQVPGLGLPLQLHPALGAPRGHAPAVPRGEGPH